MRLTSATFCALALTTLVGCGRSSEPEICPPGERTTLLRAQLRPMTPTAPFQVRSGDDVWVRTTRVPSTYDQDQLLGRTGIEVHLVRDGDTPSLARDPAIVMRTPRAWVAADVPAGAWRAYARRDPAIEIVACGR